MNEIKHEYCSLLFSLQKNCPKTTEVIFGGIDKFCVNKNQLDEIEYSLRSNIHVNELAFVDCRINAKSIISFLKNVPTRNILNVSLVDVESFTDKHLEDLIEVLLGFPSIQAITVCSNLLTDLGASVMAEYICNAKTIKRATFHSKNITDVGLESIGRASCLAQHLTHIDIGAGQLIGSGLRMLTKAITRNQNLLQVGVSCMEMSAESAFQLAKAVRASENLEYFELYAENKLNNGVYTVLEKSLEATGIFYDLQIGGRGARNTYIVLY